MSLIINEKGGLIVAEILMVTKIANKLIASVGVVSTLETLKLRVL